MIYKSLTSLYIVATNTLHPKFSFMLFMLQRVFLLLLHATPSPFVLQPHFEGKCEDETCTPKSGNLESSGTPATSELNSRGKNTLPRGVLYTVGKALKCRCRKWPRMSHLNICSTSYGQKKGRESNWQFDSRPQKVRNRPDPSVCR
jgi:hypothetical protein